MAEGANSEWRITNSKERASLFAIRFSLFALSPLPAIRPSLFALFALLIAAPAAAIECAPYCDYTHDYGPYDLSWKRPGLYAFPVCAPDGDRKSTRLNSSHASE